MLRIIGFCVGSLLSIALLLLLLGTPDFQRGTGDADEARVDAVIENLRRKWEQPAPAPADETPVATGKRGALPAAGAVPEAGSPEEPPATALPEMAGELTAPPLATAGETHGDQDPDWHAIWSPFRTEIAAQGFVSRLESVTGLDFRVAKLRSGAYQVAFAYRDPTELDASLAQIAAATGLDLSADRP